MVGVGRRTHLHMDEDLKIGKEMVPSLAFH
jgi:hypothetical protein